MHIYTERIGFHYHFSTMHPADENFDIVFAGGGATACVTAGRLAQADPSLKILILEAGPSTKDLQDHIQPARYFNNLVTSTETFTHHVGKPSASLAGRSAIVSAARCFGGGSSVNFAAYTRAPASDYDDWESLYDNPGWGSKHLIPLLKKTETYQSGGDVATHGTSGPIKASLATDEINIATQLLEVASQYDKERTSTEDINAFFTCNMYGRWARYIDLSSGKRSDTPHNFIYNQAENKNLRILTRRRVIRVVIEKNRAVGLEHVDDIVGRAKGVTEPTVSYASRLVIVAAGAFGTPAILERSGIGGLDVLKKNGIPPVVDLPGVGDHYMDHNAIFSPYHASEDADTLDIIFRGSQDDIEPFATRWLQDGQGLMSHNGLDAGIKIRPTAKDLKEIGPEFRERWKTYFENAPDKPVMWFLAIAAYVGTHPKAPQGKFFSMGYCTSHPVSTGRVHISAGLDPYGQLDFEPGYLDDPADLGVLRWMYKKGREFARRMKVYRGEFVVAHPEFPKDSNASCNGSAGPVAMDSPDIVWTLEDDRAIDEYHRKNVETSWHSIGTCAMKPREKGGVVDPRLNVYGIENLKVADCSIAPANVGANTYNTALAIGEKAAVIIAQDLKIPGVSEM